MGAGHRASGAILSGVLYIFGAAYVIAPALGWHIDTETITATFAAWPASLKLATKYFFAFPFVYHSLNGVRHLIWDTGMALSNRQALRTGWMVIGLSLVGTIPLTLM